MKKNLTNILIAIGLLVLVVITRLIPHLSNFTPIFAFGIFSVALFKNRFLATVLPITAMFISDIFIGFYPEIWAVYLSISIAMLISYSISKTPNVLKIGITSLIAPTIFFILSNLAVWNVWYPATSAGLVACYINAIPFYGYSIISTLAYSFAFFGLYKLVTKENLLLISAK
jgi:hypothetical protein